MPPLSPLPVQSLVQAPVNAATIATSISRHTAPLISRSNPDSDNTPVVVGAILGSILGAALLITLWYKCCHDNRSKVWIPYFVTNRDDDSEPASGVKHRGGTGDGFGCFNIRGHKVRRPKRARTKKDRWDRNGISMSEIERRAERNPRRHRASSCRTRQVSVANQHGLFGWVLQTRESPQHREEQELEDD
ncbi:hypothetical protein B7494_g2569 [Chlorociboria aeruginascens]|nr:hypothetical protein B7494_g2569 [Chlorociboria aeruginascens]